jgi:hypothetical protein
MRVTILTWYRGAPSWGETVSFRLWPTYACTTPAEARQMILAAAAVQDPLVLLDEDASPWTFVGETIAGVIVGDDFD